MRDKRFRGFGTLTLATLLVASVLAAPALRAQTGITVWAGAGGASTDGSMTFGRDAKQLGVQLALPLVPIAVRGDAMLFGSDIKTEAISYNLNAVFQMRLPVVQPYGVIGEGRYAVSPDAKVTGWNYGAGVRVGIGRFGVFGEVRQHDKIKRTVTVLGVTF